MRGASPFVIPSPSGKQSPSSQRDAVLERILSDGLVDAVALTRARLVAGRTGQAIEQTLNQMGVLSDQALVQAYADITQCQVWNPAIEPPLPEATNLGISQDYLRQRRLLPLRAEGSRLFVAARKLRACFPATTLRLCAFAPLR